METLRFGWGLLAVPSNERRQMLRVLVALLCELPTQGPDIRFVSVGRCDLTVGIRQRQLCFMRQSEVVREVHCLTFPPAWRMPPRPVRRPSPRPVFRRC